MTLAEPPWQNADSAQRNFHTSTHTHTQRYCDMPKPLLISITATPLPSFFSCQFFPRKIKQLRKNLDNTHPLMFQLYFLTWQHITCSVFSCLRNTVAHFWGNPTKTCQLDPLHISPLYKHIELLLPTLMNIIHRSLLSSDFPC